MKTDKTFELTTNGKNIIHTYKNGKRPLRTYGYNMSQDFAEAYLSIGTKQEIEDRKKHFKTLPKIEVTEKLLLIEVDGKEINLYDATGKTMDAYAEQEGIDFGDAKKVAEKRDIIRKIL